MSTNTYTALKTTVLSSPAATVTLDLTGITGYTDLVLVANVLQTSNGASSYYYQVNGDTGTNYSYTNLNGSGSTASSNRGSNNSKAYLAWTTVATTTNPATIIGQFQNYSNTSTYKTIVSRLGSASSGVEATVNLWRNTAAITSITFGGDITFATGSTFTVYGIAAADIGAKATGGVITSDANYWYHTFASSGTFTPTQSLSCDILAVAGGGGAASYAGGGGGAGGLLTFTGQSLTATGYTVTVGAGGANSGPDTGGNIYGSDGTSTQFGSLTALVGGGGAGGGSGGGTSSGRSGGSGGGGGGRSGSAVGGAGTSGQGYAGGANNSGGYNGGGGGGAGGAGAQGSGVGGAGGIGATSALINAMGAGAGVGQLVSGNYYLAGGGGGYGSAPSADGGYGGGGGSASANGVAGTGGGGGTSSTYAYGNGGSGVVVVRYAKA